MKTSRAVLVTGVLMVATLPLDAQTSQQDVLAVVTRFFDGMRARDAAMIASTLFSDAKLVTTTSDNTGKPIVRSEAMASFLDTIAKATGTLDERLSSPEVRVEDNLATVWARYDFYLNDTFNHCGVDAFQLVKTEAGWKIATIADTRRTMCK
jgi:hypothetical protein